MVLVLDTVPNINIEQEKISYHLTLMLLVANLADTK